MIKPGSDVAPTEWTKDDSRLIGWFECVAPPTEPFELGPGVTITDPARWWKRIAAEIAAGPGYPRARLGALQDDLSKLRAVLRRL